MRILVFLAALLCAGQAHAFTYAPEDCEFALDLPDEPYQTKRCNPEDPSQCTNLTNFTKVFGMDSTVTVNISCNPAEEGMFEKYSGDVMKMTLVAMLGRQHLTDYETGFKEFKEAKQAVILGTGMEGLNEKIYTAQLWIGRKSLLTVEASLVGEALPEADALYAEILKSVRHKDWPAPEKPTAAQQNQPEKP